MQKFKELSIEEMQEVEGGNFGSDVFERIGNSLAEFWCDLQNAHYNYKYALQSASHDSWPDEIGKIE